MTSSAAPREWPPRFVLAHGFTQTARSWDRFGVLLRERIPDCTTIAVDLPGHGDATVDPTVDLWASASHLVERGGPGIYVGYSMGGRVALHAALEHPDAVAALVLIGATAGIDDDAERTGRRAADEALADHIEAVGTEAFVDQWLTNPLFAGLDPADAMRDDRLRNDPAQLAASLRHTGTGTQEPLWERLSEITAPVLVLAGEEDPKFTALGHRLVAGLPHVDMAVIADAGHTVHLERPEATADAIARWVTGCQPS